VVTSTPEVRADSHREVPVRVLRGRYAVGGALEAATDLFDATGTPVCARPPWLTTWLEAFPAAEPVAVVAGEPGRVDGLACLAVSRRGLLRTVTLVGAGPSDYGRLPARDSAAAAALAGGIAGVLRGVRQPWRLRLDQLPVGDPVVAALLAVLPRAYLEDGQPCPQVTFGPDRLPAQLTASGRRALRKARSRLARSGIAMTVDRIRDPGQVRRLVPELIVLHRDRDHRIGRRSDLDDPGRRAFYSAVVSRLAETGQVEILVLRLDRQLAAYFLGFRDGTVYRNWDGRISSGWPELSLGLLLRTELLAELLADPELTGIDMCRGTLQHKMHGVTAVVPTVVVRAESSASVTLALRWAAHLRRTLRRRVPAGLLRRLRGLDRPIAGTGPDPEQGGAGS
jgi:CelD/BcsL family acetyltransferase involved in cellulose biosynthesis